MRISQKTYEERLEEFRIAMDIRCQSRADMAYKASINEAFFEVTFSKQRRSSSAW
jgi:hypothetical protein